MDRRAYAESLREHARLTWDLAEKADNEGNTELGRELLQLAKDTEMRAMSTWPVKLHQTVGDEQPGSFEAEADGKAEPLPALRLIKRSAMGSGAQS